MKLAIAGLIVGLFGLAVCVLSTALDYWYLVSHELLNIHIGLWRGCVKPPGQKYFNCRPIDSIPGFQAPSWLHACQVFMVLADIFIAFSVICLGLFILHFKSKLYLKRISMALCLASGACAIIAVSVYGAKYETAWQYKFGTLHAGFGLAVCGAVFGLVSGFLIGSHEMAYASI